MTQQPFISTNKLFCVWIVLMMVIPLMSFQNISYSPMNVLEEPVVKADSTVHKNPFTPASNDPAAYHAMLTNIHQVLQHATVALDEINQCPESKNLLNIATADSTLRVIQFSCRYGTNTTLAALQKGIYCILNLTGNNQLLPTFNMALTGEMLEEE